MSTASSSLAIPVSAPECSPMSGRLEPRPADGSASFDRYSAAATAAERQKSPEPPNPLETESPSPAARQTRPSRRPAADVEAETEHAAECLGWPCATPAISLPAPEPEKVAGLAAEAVADPTVTVTELPAFLETETSGLIEAPALPTGPTENWSDTLRQAPAESSPARPQAPEQPAAVPTGDPAKLQQMSLAAAPAALRLEGHPETAKDEPRMPAADNSSPPTPPVEDAGTPVAEQAVEVKNGLFQDEIAGQPARTAAISGTWRFRARGEEGERIREPRGTEFGSLRASLTGDTQPAADTAGVAETEAPPAAEPASALAPLVQEHALRLRLTSRDSLEVVLRPDANTELHLEICQRNGQIQATLRCDARQAAHWGAGWSRLQESLALHGVQLAPLAETPAGSTGGQSQRQPTPQPEPETPAPRWTASVSRHTATVRLSQSNNAEVPAIRTSRRALEFWA